MLTREVGRGALWADCGGEGIAAVACRCGWVLRVVGALGCVGAALVLVPASALATLWVSSSGTDTGYCSQANPCATISRAVSLAIPNDTIYVGAGTFIDHVTVDPSISPLTVQGAGLTATTVSGGFDGSGSVFTIQGDATATIDDLAITGGAATNGGGVDSFGDLTMSRDLVAYNAATGASLGAGLGGGVYALEPTTIQDSVIAFNQASGAGGGIASYHAEVTRSLVEKNTVSGGAGGGLWMKNGTLSDSTITANRVQSSTGGLEGTGGGVFVDGTYLAFDTIAGNAAAGGGGIGVFNDPEALGMIVSGNTGGNCSQRFFYDNGDNLEDDPGAGCGFSTASHDIVGADPLLGSLASNGGPSETMALLPGSPAIGAVTAVRNCQNLGDVDQRGFARRSASRGVCDIGAWDSGGSLTSLEEQTSTLSPGTIGLPYSQRLDAIGGTGAGTYTWSVASGSLPAGLSLSAGGLLSGTPASVGGRFTVEVTDSASPTAHVARRALSLTVYPAPKPAVWVATGANSTISAFALGAKGDAAPIRTLAGAMTALSEPDGLAFDAVGDLYVANAGPPAITEYQAGAHGNAPPIRRITGSATGLASPAGVALDSSGHLYVANGAAETVTVYGAGADGDTAPIRTISGPSTQLSHPGGLTVDSTGHLWVANLSSNTLTEYGSGADGDATPIATIGGAHTLLSSPTGLGQDATGHLLAANLSGGSVSEFPNAAPFGDQRPNLWIGGTRSGLAAPTGVDVDAANRLYVANQSGVNVFGPGGRTPLRVIAAGPTSAISNPSALAVAPPLAITTARLPTAALGRRYRERVGAALGQSPLRWRLLHGRLPRRLRLTRTGLITGMPRQAGTFRVTVAVRDSSEPRMTATHRVTLTVRRPPTITAVLTHSGPTRGGQRVTILGRGLVPGRGRTTISFGRIRALHVLCRSTRRCTARTPPHTPGTIHITLTVNGLSSVPGRSARYTYRRR